ncbi:hypothetical protein YC2023_041008 [Brassica napus]
MWTLYRGSKGSFYYYSGKKNGGDAEDDLRFQWFLDEGIPKSVRRSGLEYIKS